jgi:D-3-phosphoglycerate dehydrogenase / 2-oxoglutarate reductase
VDIERAIIEAAGLRLIAAQCRTEDEVIAAARNADAIIAQYATVGARAIDALTRCRVIARYGTGVDIVDVDAATRRGSSTPAGESGSRARPPTRRQAG